MAESTDRTAFKTFCATLLLAFTINIYIYRPTDEHLTNLMSIYTRMGSPDCVDSIDFVHVKWDRCPIELTNLFKGKEGYPTVVFSCVVDHKRRTLSISPSNF